MNKITVERKKWESSLDSQVSYQDGQLMIEKSTTILFDCNNSTQPLSIVVKPNVQVSLIFQSIDTKQNITYEISENSQVEVQHLSVDGSDQVMIYLKGEQAKVSYYYSTINRKENTYSITVEHQALKTESNIVNHGVNLNDNALRFIVNGIIPKQSIHSVCNQDTKIIARCANTSFIEPNLLIDTNEMEANHAAYIGRFPDSKVFYLMSRGIPLEKCYELLLEGFLIGNRKLEVSQKEWFLHYLQEQKGGKQNE